MCTNDQWIPSKHRDPVIKRRGALTGLTLPRFGARTGISNVICCGIFCVQLVKVRND